MQVTQWATNYDDTSVSKVDNFTKYELQKVILFDINKKIESSKDNEEFSLWSTSYSGYCLKVYGELDIHATSSTRKQYQSGNLWRNKLAVAISHIDKQNQGA